MGDGIMADTMVIQQKIEDMIDYSENQIMQFPKIYRFTLGERMLETMYQEAELAETANRKYFKKTTLQDLDIKNATLQMLVRRGHRSKYKDRNGTTKTVISDHHYEVWSEKLSEIGRMIGGWIKSQQKDKKEAPSE